MMHVDGDLLRRVITQRTADDKTPGSYLRYLLEKEPHPDFGRYDCSNVGERRARFGEVAQAALGDEGDGDLVARVVRLVTDLLQPVA